MLTPLRPALPALVSRPREVAAVPQDTQVVRLELSSGLPARVDLDATRGLVLAVPLGTARAVIATDPTAVLFDAANPSDLLAARDYGGAWPRLTLLVNGAIGDTAPVVLGVPFRLAAGLASGEATTGVAVEVTVEELVLTAGTLRSPGRFGSRLSLRWRDLTLAPDEGPPRPLGDPGIPRPVTQLATPKGKGTR